MQEFTFESTFRSAWLKVELNATHIPTPRKAITRTAMAALMTPSPRWSLFVLLISVSPSCAGELSQRFDERDREEDDARHECRDRDRYPDLLRAPLHGLDELTLHITANAARFFRDQPAEVTRLAVQC